MRSSTPHLMLALCSMAVQAAPISPAPKTPDMLTVMARSEVDARDTNNSLDVNDYRRRSTSGFPEKFDSTEQHANVRRSIGGYSYPAGTNAVGRRDEMPTTPGLTARAPINDSDADSGFDSDSASNSDSDFDSDSDDDFQGQDRFARMEVRDAPANPDMPSPVEDAFSNDMFDADADDEFEDFENDADFNSNDIEDRHAEIKRSIDALLQEDYALERRHQHPSTDEKNSPRGFDSDSDSYSDSSESDSDSDSDDGFYQSSQNSASAVPKINTAGASAAASAPEDKQPESLELSADGGQGGEYQAQVEDPEQEADAKLEMI